MLQYVYKNNKDIINGNILMKKNEYITNKGGLMAEINRQHKDRVFRMLFGYEKYKGNLLELFNALNDTDYTNPDDLQIYTLDDVFYMKMKNDLKGRSLNCRMPLRCR